MHCHCKGRPIDSEPLPRNLTDTTRVPLRLADVKGVANHLLTVGNAQTSAEVEIE